MLRCVKKLGQVIASEGGSGFPASAYVKSGRLTRPVRLTGLPY